MRVDTDALGERIAEHVAHIDAAMHLLLTDIREFDEAGGWYRQGFPSCAHWLSWRVGWSLGTAREHVRVANKLAELPQIDGALQQGKVSYSKVRAMTRVATPANEQTLLEEAELTTGQQLETICRKYATVQRHDQESNEKDDSERRYLQRRDLADGMVQIVASLHPEEAATVWAALERIMKEGYRRGESHADAHGGDFAAIDSAGTTDAEVIDMADTVDTTVRTHAIDIVPSNQRQSHVPAGTSSGRDSGRAKRFGRADALVLMAEEVIRGSRPNRSPIELVVTVAASSLRVPDPSTGATSSTREVGQARSAAEDPTEVACFSDGTAVSATVARRLACDAGLVGLVEDRDGAPLSVGRKTRAIAGNIKRALLRRDGCCRFPGCTNRLFLEGHHMRHWMDGGETKMGNLISLCSYHHRFVHEYGYRVELIGKTEVRFTDPHGVPVRASPAPAQPSQRGWETIRSRNAPLEITANTAGCWDGSRFDLTACIDELVRADDRTATCERPATASQRV